MKKSVLLLGSSCVDVIIRVEHLPKREENLHPSSQQFHLGGCACNAAAVLGLGGADVTFVTPVGLKGVFGPWVLSQLKKQPWTRPVLLPEEENGCCYCLVEPDGERTFLSIHGAEYTFSPEWMAPYRDRFFDYAYLCGLEAEEKNGDQLVSWLREAQIGQLFYAPGPRGLHIPRERHQSILALRPILHLNRSEAMGIAEKDSLPEAMDALAAQTQNDVIVTLGADGAMIQTPGRAPLHVPGEPVRRVVDTIGAGDAHVGAVLLSLSRGRTIAQSVAFANRVASRVVEQEGAMIADAGLLEHDPSL